MDKLFPQPICFRLHLSLSSSFWSSNIKYKIFYISSVFITHPILTIWHQYQCFNRIYQTSLFNFPCHKMSYISFKLSFTQKLWGDHIIDIHEIFIINNFLHTLICSISLDIFVGFCHKSRSMLHHLNLKYSNSFMDHPYQLS